jgi:hypothetical protein
MQHIKQVRPVSSLKQTPKGAHAMKRRVGIRRRSSSGIDKSVLFGKSTSLLSVNGKLRSLYYEPGQQEERSQGYVPLGIGKPIVVRYLFFFLRLDNAGNKDQEVMISSFVRTEEEKKAAAEAINFYDPKLRFSKGRAEVEGFGGDTYGHELLYYSKSFTGEPMKLTAKIMELDNPQKTIKEITDSIDRIGDLPFFAEYLPYAAIAKSSLDLLGKIFKILDRDDPIVPGLRLDLFHNRPNSARLQSGRIVCIQGKSEDEILSSGYRLNRKNHLVDANGGIYTQTPYFVLQVNSERQPTYGAFEHFQNAAELLSLTNRPQGLKEFIETAAEGFKTYADIAAVSEMESMQDDLDDPHTLERFKAMFKGLSGDVKALYRRKYQEILSEA